LKKDMAALSTRGCAIANTRANKAEGSAVS
jgi:hypothetical protein